MTEYPRAKLAHITQAAPGKPLLISFQFAPDQDRVVEVAADGSRFERVEITQSQLRNIVADGAGMLEVVK